MNEQQYIQYLWQQYVSEKATREELHALFDHIGNAAHDEENTALFEQALAGLSPAAKADPGLASTLLASIAGQDTELKEKLAALPAHSAAAIHHLPAPRPFFLRRYWVAASILLVLGMSVYLWIINKKNTQPPAVTAKTVDRAPGKDGAVLTLADGTQVVLDSLGNGLIATQNGTQALLQNGQLIYDVTGKATGEMVYNTMSTPKGRQFSMSLPDGTKVWLNAASSIRYPTAFTGNERQVEVSGEAYFEVAPHTKMSFRVKIGNRAEIEVLGTHFNVNAYVNEKMLNTTLIRGSIRITAGDRSAGPANGVVLKPGQQAQLANAQATPAAISIVNNTDIAKVMAWKNGYFNLDDLSLEELMRQVERWYDVDVVYEKGIPAKSFFGKVDRDLTLNDFMEGLKDWGVHSRLEGRKLIITGAE